MEIKRCNICNEEKDIEQFPKSGKKDNKRGCCKTCWNNYNRAYYKLNSYKYKETAKKWKELNKEKIKKDNNEWFKNKRKNDELFRFKARVRTLIWMTFKNKNYVKKSKAIEMLGCPYTFFKDYIESQFDKNMTWNNIHLDHIKPLSTAKNIEEVIILNHYTNFQPLLAKDNLIKHTSRVEKQLILL